MTGKRVRVRLAQSERLPAAMDIERAFPGLHDGKCARLVIYARSAIKAESVGFARHVGPGSAPVVVVPSRVVGGTRREGGIIIRLSTKAKGTSKWVEKAQVSVSAVSAVSPVARGPGEGNVVVTTPHSRSDHALCVTTMRTKGKVAKILCSGRAAALLNETLLAFETCTWDEGWRAVSSPEELRVQLKTLPRRDIFAQLSRGAAAAADAGPEPASWYPFAELDCRVANAGRKRARASLAVENRSTSSVQNDWKIPQSRVGPHPLPSTSLVEQLCAAGQAVLCMSPGEYYSGGLYIVDVIALRILSDDVVRHWDDTSKYGIVHRGHIGVETTVAATSVTHPQNTRLAIVGPALALPYGRAGAYRSHIESKHFEAIVKHVAITERVAMILAYCAGVTSIAQYGALMMQPLGSLGQQAHRDGAGTGGHGGRGGVDTGARIGYSVQLNAGGREFASHAFRKHAEARRDGRSERESTGGASTSGACSGAAAAAAGVSPLLDQVCYIVFYRLFYLRMCSCTHSLHSRSTALRARRAAAMRAATQSRSSCWPSSFTSPTRSCCRAARRWKERFSNTRCRSRRRRRSLQ